MLSMCEVCSCGTLVETPDKIYWYYHGSDSAVVGGYCLINKNLQHHFNLMFVTSESACVLHVSWLCCFFCTGHFVMVPWNQTSLLCNFFKHFCNLYWKLRECQEMVWCDWVLFLFFFSAWVFLWALSGTCYLFFCSSFAISSLWALLVSRARFISTGDRDWNTEQTLSMTYVSWPHIQVSSWSIWLHYHGLWLSVQNNSKDITLQFC